MFGSCTCGRICPREKPCGAATPGLLFGEYFMKERSLLHVTEFVSSQALSETEAINNIISKILLNAEKKNADPIKFCWNNKITGDGQLSTQYVKESRSLFKQDSFDLNSEILGREDERTTVISNLNNDFRQIKKENRTPLNQKFVDQHFELVRREPHNANRISNIQNNIQKTNKNIKNLISDNILDQNSPIRRELENGNRILSLKSDTRESNKEIDKPVCSKMFNLNSELKRDKEDITRIPDLKKDTQEINNEIENPINEKFTHINAKLLGRDREKSIRIIGLQNEIQDINWDKVKPVQDTITDDKPMNFDAPMSETGSESQPSPIYLSNTEIRATTLPMQQKIKQKNKYTSNTAPSTTITMPRTFSHNQALFAQKSSGVSEEVTDSLVKKTQKMLSPWEISPLTDTSTVEYEPTIQETKISDKLPKSSLSNEMGYLADANVQDDNISLPLNDDDSSVDSNNINSSKNTEQSEDSTSRLVIAIKNIESEVDKIPNYKPDVIESVADLLSKMLKDKSKGVVVTTDGNYYSAAPTYKESDVQSIAMIKDENIKVEEPMKFAGTTMSDLNLLLSKNTASKTFVTLQASDAEPTKATNQMNSRFESTTTEKFDNNKKLDFSDLYKEIIEIYADIKEMSTQKLTKDKSESSREKAKDNAVWSKIKHFFGHDRVCDCKCRANRTMCRVCAASDAVIRQLTFEFNNLANYMNQHCTEIQTYFWRNPSGGKKLRDAVHRIDRTVNDYYKRVRGKCNGRTCQTFSSYMDKRHGDYGGNTKVIKNTDDII